ncbi:helix-turn-helix domain-containing protein [Paenibacillus melissococcoides]|uniref:Helix-turn-helix domain-containing protein n=1 Tax=Paenibacillus melissococcoides TaxID=2912268 RepID=A0ABM9GE98_9BACL|nr:MULTISPECIES: helix-turn-helix domain-containing protein [Paenibacillus]GIO82940.1 transcriptional regulator [Paenibacillus dendritiformis]CAH8249612.1 helix-turn-helix domain-containing protein [Paenibacillus melissococcoides]CAH8721388.1 helix-turn-helix domain-containing protein [Paenibacillus melissococcoides]CAH8721832.1 helix-turn-helix domain-containing protein [Paenibacillus melissococcoides]
MSIGRRIKELRKEKGVSQKDLAETIGVSRGNVGDWELDKVKPGADALLALSEYFEVTTDWLLSGNEPSNARKLVQGSALGISPSDLELLAKYHQLEDRDKIKIEERIEVLLELAGKESDSSSKHAKSHISTNGGNGKEEAATRPA